MVYCEDNIFIMINRVYNQGDQVREKDGNQVMTVEGYEYPIIKQLVVNCSWIDENGNHQFRGFNESEIRLVENIVFIIPNRLDILNEDGEIEENVDDHLSGFVHRSMDTDFRDRLYSCVHNLFCDTPEHMAFENLVKIQPNGKDFNIEKCCCSAFESRLYSALLNI